MEAVEWRILDAHTRLVDKEWENLGGEASPIGSV